MTSLAANQKATGADQFDYEGPYRAWVDAGKPIPEPNHPSWCDEEKCFYAGAGQWSHSKRFEEGPHWVDVAWLEHTPFEGRVLIPSDVIDMTEEDALMRARLYQKAASFQPEEETPKAEVVEQVKPLPVMTNRNAPCDIEWKGGVQDALDRAGHSYEHIFWRGMDDAREDGRNRVYFDLKGSPKPTELLLAVFEPVELGSGLLGADLGYWGWRVLKKQGYDLQGEGWTPDVLGRFVAKEIRSMTSEVFGQGEDA